MSTQTRPRPAGGPLLSRPLLPLFALFGLACLIIVWRFAAGIGPVSGLSDGYPWGIWIAFDVVTGTALACGGYAIAILVYIMNRGRYHPLVRPAILTSALGYTIAGLSLAVDVGRPWNFWRVPIFVNQWNFNSALLEVALCIMSYIAVLWIELSPAFLESFRDSRIRWLARPAAAILPVVERSLVWIIALGMLLPTMHQSSLGTLMILTGAKLHPFWQTPLLPLLFLVSCLVIGYAALVFESSLAARFFGRKPETGMLASLSGAMRVVLALFLLIRLIDLGVRGQLAAVVTDPYGFLLAAELAMFVAPLVLLRRARTRPDAGELFRGAMLMMLAGAFYRFNSFLIAFNPGAGWSYFPTIPEMLITAGLVALEILAYVALVRTFPILGGMAREST